jgi:outer membrane protein TolC
LAKAQALLSFKRLEDNIILEVRDRVRQTDTGYRQIITSRVAREKEVQNYTAQKERYVAGQVSTHDLLDYQDNLSTAELDYIQSLVGYKIALFELERAEGLTLVKNDIKLE